MRSIRFGNNLFAEISFEHNPNLDAVVFYDSLLTSVDFSNNAKMCVLLAEDNVSLRDINFRNGTNTYFDPSVGCNGTGGSTLFDVTNNVNLEFICVDSIAFAETFFTDIPNGVTFLEDCSLGITEYYSAQISVYPNPTSDILNIQSEALVTSIEIFDVLGQSLVLLSNTGNNGQLDISNLSSGNYFVRIGTVDSSSVYQIIKE